MIIVKSVVVGVATALAAAVIYVVALFAYFLLLRPLVEAWSSGTGSMGAGVVVGSGSVFAAALVGFVVGFYWKFRSEMRATERL